MKAKEASQARANRTCAQVWAGQVQEGAGHARTMFTRRHGARMHAMSIYAHTKGLVDIGFVNVDTTGNLRA